MKTIKHGLKLLLAILLAVGQASAECAFVDFDANSNILRVKFIDTTDNQGLTGLTSASSGLRIAIAANNEATTTAYTVAGSTIEGITTLGTYAAPTATKIRFKEYDATNHPGVYEIQAADARFSVAGAKSLLISASGATNMQEMDCQVQLTTTLTDLVAAILNATAGDYDNSGSIGEAIGNGGAAGGVRRE